MAAELDDQDDQAVADELWRFLMSTSLDMPARDARRLAWGLVRAGYRRPVVPKGGRRPA